MVGPQTLCPLTRCPQSPMHDYDLCHHHPSPTCPQPPSQHPSNSPLPPGRTPLFQQPFCPCHLRHRHKQRHIDKQIPKHTRESHITHKDRNTQTDTDTHRKHLQTLTRMNTLQNQEKPRCDMKTDYSSGDSVTGLLRHPGITFPTLRKKKKKNFTFKKTHHLA